MSQAMRIARAARRRRRARRLLRTLGRGMLFASILGIALVLADRLLTLEMPIAALVAPPAALVGALLVIRLLRAEALAPAAQELDDALHLDDAISTGVELEEAGAGGPFERLAMADAERVAGEARVSRGVPVVDPRPHRWWPVAAAAFVALAVWLPPRGAVTQARAAAEQRAEQAEARERIAEVREQTELEIDAAPELIDEATRRDLEALKQIEEELEQGFKDPDEAGAQAAEKLAEAADRMEQEAAQRRRTLEELQKRVGETESDNPLTDALARGDFASAAEELSRMQRELEGASPEERQALAERLREAAESIDATPAEAPPSPEERLAQEGVDPERARELAGETDPDRLREALEQEGADPLEAQRLADELSEQARDREAQRQAEEAARELRESLEQAAEQAEQPEPQESPEPQPQTEGQPTEPGSGGPQPAQPGSTPEQTPGPSPSSNQRQEGGQDQQTPAQGDQPDQQPSGQQTGEQSGDQQGAPQQGQGQPEQRQGGQQPGQRPGGQQPGTQPGTPGGQQGQADGLDRAQRLTRQLEEQGRDAGARSRQAERFREGADRLARRQPSPSTGSDVGGGADRAPQVRTEPGEASDALQTEGLDIRRGAESDRTIAEVDAEGPARAGRTPSRAEAARTLEQAAPGAERALENQGVPTRFRELVKRYFRQSGESELAPAPLAPPSGGGDGDGS